MDFDSTTAVNQYPSEIAYGTVLSDGDKSNLYELYKFTGSANDSHRSIIGKQELSDEFLRGELQKEDFVLLWVPIIGSYHKSARRCESSQLTSLPWENVVGVFELPQYLLQTIADKTSICVVFHELPEDPTSFGR